LTALQNSLWSEKASFWHFLVQYHANKHLLQVFNPLSAPVSLISQFKQNLSLINAIFSPKENENAKKYFGYLKIENFKMAECLNQYWKNWVVSLRQKCWQKYFFEKAILTQNAKGIGLNPTLKKRK
jgi:hypothetical protein